MVVRFAPSKTDRRSEVRRTGEVQARQLARDLYARRVGIRVAKCRVVEQSTVIIRAGKGYKEYVTKTVCALIKPLRLTLVGAPGNDSGGTSGATATAKTQLDKDFARADQNAKINFLG